jgi:soluble lytic murein transglycosylase-like protein
VRVRRRIGGLLAAGLAVLLASGPAAPDVALAAPAPAPALLRDGASAFAKGRLADAEAIFTGALAARPADVHASLWLGVVRYHRGNVSGAEQAMAYAVRLAPRDAVVLLWWGHLLARTGQTEQAAQTFRRALLGSGPPRVHQLAEQGLRAVQPLPVVAAAPSATEKAEGRPVAPSWVHDVESYRAIAFHYNPRLSPGETEAIARALLGYSRKFDLDPRLMVALVVVESGFQPRAQSRAGAMGLGQLMPGTARALGVNPWDPTQNLYGSIRYLRGNLDRFGWQNTHLALAAYNAGRGAVERYEGIPPYAETQWYVVNVTSLYRRLVAISGKIPELRSRLAEN